MGWTRQSAEAIVQRIRNWFSRWDPPHPNAGDLRKGQPIPVVTPAKAGVQKVLKDLIGVGTAGCPAAPPSEPYVRISRIRLSSRWFTAERIDRPVRGL